MIPGKGVVVEISEQGLSLIKVWEGLEDGDRSTKNVFEPYMDPIGIWTIGYGHVLYDKYKRQLRGPEGKREAYAQYPGGITEAEASAMLLADVRKFTDKLSQHNILGSQNQIDALTSFAFNLGMGDPANPHSGGLLHSTLLRMHRAGGPDLRGEMTQEVVGLLARKSKMRAPIKNLPEAFCAWSNAGKKWWRGLFRRRLCEYMIYRGDTLNKALEVARGYTS